MHIAAFSTVSKCTLRVIETVLAEGIYKNSSLFHTHSIQNCCAYCIKRRDENGGLQLYPIVVSAAQPREGSVYFCVDIPRIEL